MTARHELKVWPSHYEAIERGDLAFFIREDKRNFAVGDELHLREFDAVSSAYTGRDMHARITYVVHGPDWNMPVETCAMSFVRIFPPSRTVADDE